MDGHGTEDLKDGDKYVGEWIDGLKLWKRNSLFSDGREYVAEFKDGEQHGQGTHTLTGGGKVVGEWREGEYWNVTKYGKNGNIIGKCEN